jgi:hypothetical protein
LFISVLDPVNPIAVADELVDPKPKNSSTLKLRVVLGTDHADGGRSLDFGTIFKNEVTMRRFATSHSEPESLVPVG